MLRTYLFWAGGLLLVTGAALPLFIPTIAPYVFTAGALLFCSIQMSDRYEGTNLVIKRLRRQQLLGALMLLVTAALMFTSHLNLRPFNADEWKVTLMIATLLEAYSTIRLDKEANR